VNYAINKELSEHFTLHGQGENAPTFQARGKIAPAFFCTTGASGF
jgi:hypothetical protein